MLNRSLTTNDVSENNNPEKKCNFENQAQIFKEATLPENMQHAARDYIYYLGVRKFHELRNLEKKYSRILECFSSDGMYRDDFIQGCQKGLAGALGCQSCLKEDCERILGLATQCGVSYQEIGQALNGDSLATIRRGISYALDTLKINQIHIVKGMLKSLNVDFEKVFSEKICDNFLCAFKKSYRFGKIESLNSIIELLQSSGKIGNELLAECVDSQDFVKACKTQIEKALKNFSVKEVKVVLDYFEQFPVMNGYWPTVNEDVKLMCKEALKEAILIPNIKATKDIQNFVMDEQILDNQELKKIVVSVANDMNSKLKKCLKFGDYAGATNMIKLMKAFHFKDTYIESSLERIAKSLEYDSMLINIPIRYDKIKKFMADYGIQMA